MSVIQIIRSKRKSITLQVTSEGTLILKVPLHVSKKYIDSFIVEKKAWIKQKTQELYSRNATSEKKYIKGEEFLYIGKRYILDIGQYKALTIEENYLHFPNFLQFRIQKEIASWYVQQAKEIITKRVQFYASQMRAEYALITFSDTKSRWGSCSHDNKLQFNWRLIMAPLAVIDYVVVHELSHTFEKNHTWMFWSKVRFVLPAYKQRRKWLLTFGNSLHV